MKWKIDIKRYINENIMLKIKKRWFMAKKNISKCYNSEKDGCLGCRCSIKGNFAAVLVLIGIAYVLQNSGILFGNVVLWPWVLIALGLCTYLLKRKY